MQHFRVASSQPPIRPDRIWASATLRQRHSVRPTEQRFSSYTHWRGFKADGSHRFQGVAEISTGSSAWTFGNGATCNMLSILGFKTTGVDISESGIAHANTSFPHVAAFVGSAYDDLAKTYGTFPQVVSLEVIEHCMDRRGFAKTFLSLIALGGVGFLVNSVSQLRQESCAGHRRENG
jgi:hypothetical protein